MTSAFREKRVEIQERRMRESQRRAISELLGFLPKFVDAEDLTSKFSSIHERLRSNGQLICRYFDDVDELFEELTKDLTRSLHSGAVMMLDSHSKAGWFELPAVGEYLYTICRQESEGFIIMTIDGEDFLEINRLDADSSHAFDLTSPLK